jgi:ATP-dependent Clp protease ATP-binding subunit ClpX
MIYNFIVNRNQDSICAFCGRTKDQVEHLICRARDVPTFICNHCVEICHKVLKELHSEKRETFKLLTPQEIFNELSLVVEGQDAAKRLLATSSYNHYKKCLVNESDIKIDKSNILMIGKSGSGKTLIAETLSKILNVPFASVDATTITEAGYVGDDTKICVERLLKAANYDVEKAEMGIVFIDEIDKTRTAQHNEARDVSGRGVQNAFLKMIEDTTVEVAYKKGGAGDSIPVRTKNILFIFAGAFSDLPTIIKKDIKRKTNPLSVGEKEVIKAISEDQYSEIMKHMTHDHLERYGIIPELLGRIPNRVVLDELTEQDLINIMYRPRNAILKQYQKLLELNDNARLRWTDAALMKIAKKAIAENTGARGLKTILEKILMEVMFKIPSMKKPVTVVIDEKTVDENSEPVLEFEEDTLATQALP